MKISAALFAYMPQYLKGSRSEIQAETANIMPVFVYIYPHAIVRRPCGSRHIANGLYNLKSKQVTVSGLHVAHRDKGKGGGTST